MADREERVRIFEETVGLYTYETSLREDVHASVKGQSVIMQEDPLFGEGYQRYSEAAKVRISDKRTMGAALPYAEEGKKVCILNFASSVTPGGGVTWGASAQEESLCRISTLYAAITDDTALAFYKRHHELIASGEMGRENRDDCIFTPGVTVIREDDFSCSLLEKDKRYKVDVITCAAPDLRYSSSGKTYRPTEEELKERHIIRGRKIMDVAAKKGEEVLILGAFGCGAFCNPPLVVASAYKEVLKEFAHAFEVIEFAIPNAASENHIAFSGILG